MKKEYFWGGAHPLLPLNAAAAFAILPQLAAKAAKKIISNNSL